MFICICPICQENHKVANEDFGALVICKCGIEFDSAINELTNEMLENDELDKRCIDYLTDLLYLQN
jgi:hypothetical protein